MKFVEKFKQKATSWFGGGDMQAAAALPPVPLPKAPKGVQSLPGYRTNVQVSTSAVQKKDRQLATTDRLVTAREATTTAKLMRGLVKGSPDLGSAVSFLLRTGIPEKFTVAARDMDGSINPAATGTAHELLRRMTYMGNVDGSFGAQMGLQSLSEQLAIEAVLDGAMCLEVSLDKARVPASMNPISVTTIKMYEEDNAFRLVQVVGGTEIDLDLPTVIYVSVDQLQTEAYASSYLESAIQPIMQDLDFNNDTRRALKRAVLPRLKASIDSEAVKKMTPPDILADADQFETYKRAITNSISDVINGLNPEDAIVSLDMVEYSFIDGGQDPAAIIERVQNVINSKLAAGAKTLPVILGRAGTSNASSAESLLYLKQANMLRVKLNELYSRALTIAVRLLGLDCYVEFKYAEIDLRPASELEAYVAMKQSRYLDLLSLGMISDEECCLELTGNLPPAGYKPLMGTRWRDNSQSAQPNAQPGTAASGTSAMDKTLSGGGAKNTKTQK